MAFTLAESLFANPVFVIPAQAGIQNIWPLPVPLDSGLRRDDGYMSLSKRHSGAPP
ncbi:hypothetical protein N9H39_04730 [Gammaproteobacteria bacterium]|nr:hypothetical protein [Gammaproteobacteria bacterium]